MRSRSIWSAERSGAGNCFMRGAAEDCFIMSLDLAFWALGLHHATAQTTIIDSAESSGP